MKRFLALILILSLCLAGCGSKTETKAHTFEDLTIQIPTDYIALVGADFASELDFVFGLDPIAVNGLREEKATFAAYGLDLTLEDYAKFIIMANSVAATPEQKDGILTFTYESGGFTYVVTVWETAEAFWTVQAYCPAEDYGKVKSDMWDILSSVTV